jgi:hypothetical protein
MSKTNLKKKTLKSLHILIFYLSDMSLKLKINPTRYKRLLYKKRLGINPKYYIVHVKIDEDEV